MKPAAGIPLTTLPALVTPAIAQSPVASLQVFAIAEPMKSSSSTWSP
ncbi:MAG: hypothetical protein ABSA39_01150 [Edaphobacter sp.]